MLRYSIKTVQNQNLTLLNQKLIEYAKLLAEQGCFITAFNYLKDRNDVKTPSQNSVHTIFN
jgi:hypothetical protein